MGLPTLGPETQRRNDSSSARLGAVGTADRCGGAGAVSLPWETRSDILNGLGAVF